MPPTTNHKRLDAAGQVTLREALQERMRLAIKFTLIRILEEEVEAFVNASLYQRTSERRDDRTRQIPFGSVSVSFRASNRFRPAPMCCTMTGK